MKLAEALLYRSELQKKQEDLKSRILLNLKVQDGEKPYEEPNELIKELLLLEDELCDIVIKINKANLRETLDIGTTLSEALATRECLMKKRNVLSDIAENAADKEFRYSRSEIKIFTTVDVEKIQKQKDEISKKIRELDSVIQQKNWTAEL